MRRRVRFLVFALVLATLTTTAPSSFSGPPPPTAESYLQQGVALYNKGKYVEAIELFKKALGLNPKYVRAYSWLGYAYTKMGWNDKAVVAFKQVIALAPQSQDATVAREWIGRLTKPAAHTAGPAAPPPANSLYTPAPTQPTSPPAQTVTARPNPASLVVAVIVSEKDLSNPNVVGTAVTTVLTKRLIAAGYTVVQQDQTAPIAANAAYVGQLMTSASVVPQARSLGTRLQAAVLLVGQASSEGVGAVGGQPAPTVSPTGTGAPPLQSARAQVTLHLILTSTGQVVGMASATASGVDLAPSVAGQKALAGATDHAASSILPKLAALLPGSPGSAVPPTGPAAQPAPTSPPATQAGPLRIAVLKFGQAFTNPTWAGTWDISGGVTDKVEQALFETGHYKMLDRRALQQVLTEQGLGQTGAVTGDTAPRIGRVTGAQDLVSGDVTQFELQGFGGALFGPIGLGVYTANVHLTSRVVDTTDGTIRGIAEGIGRSQGALGVASFAGVTFGGAEFDKTVLGRALDQAVKNLTGKVVAQLNGP